jgi:hypothetical protein
MRNLESPSLLAIAPVNKFMATEKLSPEDYEKLKLFIGLFFDWYDDPSNSMPDCHPLLAFVRIQKEHGLANAKRGLQMAINDTVEMTADWHPDKVAEADAKFAAAGTFTLSEIRRRYSKKYLQILKRGEIRTAIEYYLLKGILDGGSIEPGATENQQIQTLMTAFEAKIVQDTAK